MVMSLCTFGIYEFYWARNQWRAERLREGASFSPFWRAIFAPFTAFRLFARIQRVLSAHGVRTKWSSFILATLYLVLSFAWCLPLESLSFVAALSFIPLCFVQHSVNKLNLAVAPEVPRNDRYSLPEVAIIVLGCVLHVLVLVFTATVSDALSILSQSM